MKKKKSLNINPYILLFSVIFVCGLLSYIIPAGSFERQVVDGKTMVVPNSYKVVDPHHASIIDIFRAVPYGFIGSAPVIAIILIIGGTLKIYDQTEAIPLAIYKLISKLGTKSSNLLIIAFYLIFALLGGFLGWIETMLPFTPLVVAIMLALGLDSLVAVSIVIVGLMAGFLCWSDKRTYSRYCSTNFRTTSILRFFFEICSLDYLFSRLSCLYSCLCK